MKYYKIRTEIDLGQRTFLGEAYDLFKQANSETNLNDIELPNFKPVFAKLYIKGEMTEVIDELTTNGPHFIFNNRVKEVFEKYNLGPHRIYPLGEAFDYDSRENLKIEYFKMQIIRSPYEDWIDYEKSIFALMDNTNLIPEKIKNIKINNKVKLKEIIKDSLEHDRDIYYEKLIFNKVFSNLNLDLFYFFGIQENKFGFPIISERLKKRLEEESITGFEIKEVNIEV